MAANLFLRRWRKLFWHLHRRAGITSLLFLAIMAITGIALNHVDSWKLFDKPLPYKLSSWVYGNIQKEVYTFNLGSQNLYQSGDIFYLEGNQLDFDCSSNVAKNAQGTSPSVALISKSQEQSRPQKQPGTFWISCQSSIYGFQLDGVFIEKIPLQIKELSQLGTCTLPKNHQPVLNLCIKQFDQWYVLDDRSLELSRLNDNQSVELLEHQLVTNIPKSLKVTPPELNIGRLIADIHSGAIFGKLGRLFVDLLGFVVLFLCGTGCYLWLGNKRP